MESPDEIIRGALRSSLERLIRDDGIQTLFQPIVDLQGGALLGYEALSRGILPFHRADVMFDTARECGMSWDLDRACRLTALRCIATLPLEARELSFFINISPRSITDGRAIEGFALSAMKALGIQNRIVMEITETASITDYAAFEEQIRHHVRQGFGVALDDFGSGNSGLLMLVAAAPHFIKLDRALVAGVDRSPYRQELIRAVTTFAQSVGTDIIGEGIEQPAERATLARLGVRYGQGFLLGRPAPYPSAGAAEAQGILGASVPWASATS